ncbi:MAG TPA: LuxR C-terminal-related transcriptional regulator [Streptosporangiaceae bacterium]|nr:LuxR C-terminal-related transcriptional regulator [Streptosporangiaceae bacterium]
MPAVRRSCQTITGGRYRLRIEIPGEADDPRPDRRGHAHDPRCPHRADRPGDRHAGGGTTRETDVLREAQNGTSTEDIGTRLALAPATVRNYLSNAISKTGARNRIDAIRIARDAGWL